MAAVAGIDPKVKKAREEERKLREESRFKNNLKLELMKSLFLEQPKNFNNDFQWYEGKVDEFINCMEYWEKL